MAISHESDRKAAASPSTPRPCPELASALRSQANQIVQAWMGAVVAAIPPAIVLPSKELQEHLPAILVKMADVMEGVVRRDVGGSVQRSAAQESSVIQRPYDARALLTEDRLLRRVINDRVRVALGRQMIQTERAALDTAIDTMLRDVMRAQNRWATPPMRSSRQQSVVMRTAAPVAHELSPSSSSAPPIAADPSPGRSQGANPLSDEKPAATTRPVLPAALPSKAAIPVFVEPPAPPPVAPAPIVAGRAAPSPAVELNLGIRAAPEDRTSEAIAAPHRYPDNYGECAAHSPPATAAFNAVAAEVNGDQPAGAAAASPKISGENAHEWIAVAAFFIWENHGRQEGRALDDWLQAEGQFNSKKR